MSSATVYIISLVCLFIVGLASFSMAGESDLASLLGGEGMGGGMGNMRRSKFGFGAFPSMDPICKTINDCPCGTYCVSGENTTCTIDSSEDADCSCQSGCVLFDRFLAPKSPEDVYGRKCQCGNYVPIVRGRLIWCEKGDWVEPPANTEITQYNPNCAMRLWRK